MKNKRPKILHALFFCFAATTAVVVIALVFSGCGSKSSRANTNPNAGPERYGYAPITVDRVK
ncbi:MAG TPA: hypothetical protein VFG11_08820, partial [Acidobacteriota bacterium]|nr:hypothetical protein [Acidobacteriota bacterium]